MNQESLSRYQIGIPGVIEATILNFGARLHKLKVNNGNHMQSVLQTYSHAESHLADPFYMGATVGRYANRIANGQLFLSGETYKLNTNAGNHCLHGGESGFSQRFWQVLEHSQNRILLSLTSPHLDMGFPGEVKVTQAFEVSDKQLKISFNASTSKPTVLNLTNHAYFNFSDEKTDLRGHYLRVDANEYAQVNSDGIPTGTAKSTHNTALDFSETTSIADRLESGRNTSLFKTSKGLDHCYHLYKMAQPEGSSSLPNAATLSYPKNELTMQVLTDHSALQIYSGNFLTDPFNRQSAICLEAQHYVDGPNQPNFDSGILLPHQHYDKTIIYRF